MPTFLLKDLKKINIQFLNMVHALTSKIIIKVFDRDDMKDDDKLGLYEQWCYEYTKKFKNKSATSRLYKLVFNK